MSRWLLLLVTCTTILLAGCEPEPRTFEVQYEVVRLSPANGVEYSLKFTTENGSLKSIGSIQEVIWRSEVYELEEDDPIELTIQLTSGRGEFELNVLRDGGLHETINLQEPDQTISIKSRV